MKTALHRSCTQQPATIAAEHRLSGLRSALEFSGGEDGRLE